MILAGAHIILPDRVLRAGHLRIEEGLIAEVSGSAIAPRAGEEVLDLGECYLSPGFIDLHIHGALGRDAMEASAEAFDTICRHHASGGTTALCLTTIAAPLEQILAVIEPARGAARRARPGRPRRRALFFTGETRSPSAGDASQPGAGGMAASARSLGR